MGTSLTLIHTLWVIFFSVMTKFQSQTTDLNVWDIYPKLVLVEETNKKLWPTAIKIVITKENLSSDASGLLSYA